MWYDGKELYPYQMPVGTKFYVTAGNWNGEVVEKDGKTFVQVDGTTLIDLSERAGDSVIGYIIEDDADEDGKEKPVRYTEGDLMGADPDCEHEVVGSWGGGIKCVHCPGWFCY